jgi:hypothetical protein
MSIVNSDGHSATDPTRLEWPRNYRSAHRQSALPQESSHWGGTICSLHNSITATRQARPINLIRLSHNIRSPFIVKGVAFLPPSQPTLPPMLCRLVWKPAPFFYLPTSSSPISSPFPAAHRTGHPECRPQPLDRGSRTRGSSVHQSWHWLQCSWLRTLHTIHTSGIRILKSGILRNIHDWIYKANKRNPLQPVY